MDIQTGPHHRQRPQLNHEALQQRFAVALNTVGARHDGATFSDLHARYAEKHRCYHTLRHVDSCLSWLDWFTFAAERPAEVELALWFHDVVYDPTASDNEAKSAEFAHQRLRAVGVPSDSLERICQHIMATADHQGICGDAALVVDIDLAILAANGADFARFEAQIRKELEWVPEPLYRLGRRRVLKRFYRRPFIYSLAPLRELFESAAKNNLRRVLEEGPATNHKARFRRERIRNERQTNRC